MDRAEVGERLGQLVEREARLVVGAAVAGDREEPVAGDRERGARVAPVGDVGVELVGGGAEALASSSRSKATRPSLHEQRAGLEQVAARAGREVGRRAMLTSPPEAATHARRRAPRRWSNGTCRRRMPRVRSSPSGRKSCLPPRTKKPPTIASLMPVRAQ